MARAHILNPAAAPTLLEPVALSQAILGEAKSIGAPGQCARLDDLAGQLHGVSPGRIDGDEARIAFWANLYHTARLHEEQGLRPARSPLKNPFRVRRFKPRARNQPSIEVALMERQFDVVVIGAGPAGEIAAGRLVDRGARSVAIVESHLVGGECSFYACMPSKALLRPQELLSEVARVPGAAEAVTGDLDVAAVLHRRDEIIANLDDAGQVPWLEQRGIELIRGHARLEGGRRVRVGDQLLVAREAVIVAVGSGPLEPPIPGLADARAWSNREIATARQVPESLVVLGGGVVGVEMAQAWASLGSRVEVVEAADRLLPREEPFVGEELAAELEERGIEIHTGVKAVAVSRGDGAVTVELESGERVTGERLLVAIGRRPLTDDIGLETVGLRPSLHIDVDDRLQVSGLPWLYAVGDVNGRSLLTHCGKYQARVAADVILGLEARAETDGPGAPRVVFTDPQVAAVGETLASARARGIAAEAIDLPTSGTAGASFYGRNAAGTTRFVVDTEREVLVGVTFVGPEVADMLQAATIAVVGEVPFERLVHAVAPFPTRSELWLKFVEAYEERRVQAGVAPVVAAA